MPKYVPPHLRPGYIPEVPKTVTSVIGRKRGIHFKSDITGLPSHNIKTRFFDKNEPLKLSRQVNRSRLLSRRTIKSALKGKRTSRIKARSAEPMKRRRTRRVHSK
jgi:hypothetical protein